MFVWQKRADNPVHILIQVLRQNRRRHSNRHRESAAKRACEACGCGRFLRPILRRLERALLVGFLQGENTENWICNIAKLQDRCRDMIALSSHYVGNGNSARGLQMLRRFKQFCSTKRRGPCHSISSSTCCPACSLILKRRMSP